MNKILIGVLFLICSIASFASNNVSVAMVKKVNGDVSVKRANVFVKSTLGQKLYENDVILTGKNGNIGIVFNDGSILNLSEGSVIKIENFIFKPVQKDFKFSLNMTKGKGVFESGKIGKLSPKSFKMKFPDGVVGIRGTKFLLEVD